jgi:sugar phosphate isomerase/epimerase
LSKAKGNPHLSRRPVTEPVGLGSKAVGFTRGGTSVTQPFSRRALLGTAAAAAVAATVKPVASFASPPAGGLKLGVASYSLREFSLDQALEMAKTLGVTHMTFKDVHLPRTDPPETTRALAAKIKAVGITIMGGGTINLPNDAAQIKKDFEYAKNASFPLIFISPDPAALDVVEQMAKTYDIKAAIHNHGPEDKWWPRPQDAYAAIKSRDKRLGLCIDVGHTLRTGTDPVRACRECRDRLYDMHVKDLKAKTDRDSQTEVGRGLIDYPALFKTLLEIGYQGQVGLEYEINAKNPLPGMIESLAYMRGVLAAVTT